MKWYENAIFYHIYPLGFCGAPQYNEGGEPVNRIDKVRDWIPHLKEMQVDAVYFGPVFESVEHGYDTTDYRQIDRRLGTNEIFAALCDTLHENGIRVVLDGVFNHVGRNFPYFKDVQEKKWDSPYCDWFAGLNFNGQSPCGDPFWYEGWNGYYNLVKLNLKNPKVCDYLLDCIQMWMDTFHIDGIRFDAADCVDFNFFRRVRTLCKSQNPDFWLMGEVMQGDYKRWANDEMLDSVTNYECYKGIYSSHNSENYFEINYSINRQSGDWAIYPGLVLYNFVDNHDMNRLASTLREPRHLPLCYTLLYCMPGIPSVYYGSEYGVTGKHENNSDAALRPCLDLDTLSRTGNLELYHHIVKLGRIRKAYPALRSGKYRTVEVRNKQLLFSRELDGKYVFVALNLEDQPSSFYFQSPTSLVDVLTGKSIEVKDGNAVLHMEPFSQMILVEDDIVHEIRDEESAPVLAPVVITEGQRYRDTVEQVDCVVLHAHVLSETGEDLVVYKRESDDTLCALPRTTFTSLHNESQHRFEPLEETK